jgi:hypothetical protein
VFAGFACQELLDDYHTELLGHFGHLYPMSQLEGKVLKLFDVRAAIVRGWLGVFHASGERCPLGHAFVTLFLFLSTVSARGR